VALGEVPAYLPEAVKEPDKTILFRDWAPAYLAAQKLATGSINIELVGYVVEKLFAANKQGKMVFVFGNGGSAANASHFATDLGKGASKAMPKKFKVLSLNDNTGWIMALSNDDNYDESIAGQLENYGSAGDVAIGISVSGNSPNCVNALAWAKENGLVTIAITGANKCRMREIADRTISINETHYGRVEDAQMTVLHMICYAFMELAYQ